jgi:hypothetical protein
MKSSLLILYIYYKIDKEIIEVYTNIYRLDR